MSIEIGQHGLKQRRLGILRNSYPPNVVIQTPLYERAITSAKARSTKTTINNVLSNDVCKEKLNKLRQISIDNAARTMKALPVKVPEKDRPLSRLNAIRKTRCSTAPTCGDTKTFNSQARRPRTTSCSSTNEQNLSKINKQFFDKNRLPSLERQRPNAMEAAKEIDSYNKSQHRTAPRGSTCLRFASRNLSRSLSAPSSVYRSSTLQGIQNPIGPNANETRNSLYSKGSFGHMILSNGMQTDRKRASTAPFSRRKPQNFGGVSGVISCKEGLIKLDEGPLGIVGETCTSVRYKQPNARLKHSVKLRKEKMIPRKMSECPPDNPPPSPRQKICLVPKAISQSLEAATGCTCRTVRFSCTSNQIHEYKTTEPINADVNPS
ncbi:uncharacterized protein LOC143458887 [Clavelina lepadiformis]|uniref:Uncharacterized protein n=1 Tax=Clavelina lepadiformis TaxID=159417 RepID=A0ABP0H0U3_CLALP